MFVLQKIEIAKYGPKKGKPVKLFLQKIEIAKYGNPPKLFMGVSGFPTTTTEFDDACLFKTKKEAIRAKKTSSYWKDYQAVDVS